jgi:Ca-activated chloride channel family protein
MVSRIPLATGICLALAAGAAGAALVPALDGQDRPQFSVASELVVLNVSVTDRRGGYLPALTPESFSIFDAGQPPAIGAFTHEDAPATIGLVVDDSESMRPSLERVVAAARAFAERGNPQDELFAIVFNEHVRPALPASDPFTSDSQVLRDALDNVLHARGRTALFDALAAALEYGERGHHQRRVLVVLSDGGDNASASTRDEALDRVRTSNAVIYTVALVDRDDRESDLKLLKRLSDATGGQSFEPDNREEIGEALDTVAADIRGSYTLGFSPAADRTPGFHRIKVEVDPPDHRKVTVRTRAGYLAGTGAAAR